MTPVRPALLLVLSLLAGCAGAGVQLPSGRGDAPPALARQALDALVLGQDAGLAASRASAALAAHPRDPWAHLAAALLCRRGLDAGGEAEHLEAVARLAPDHPLALVALRRLGELVDDAPATGRLVEAATARLSGGGGLRGLAAFRARVARLSAADAEGDLERVARLRAENGAVTAWTLAGPFGALHAFDLLRPFAPEEGRLPAEAPAPLLGAPRPSRPIATPDGLVTLEGEPFDGEVHYLAAELTLARGGDYLAVLGTAGSARAWLDGAPLLERRAFDGPAPGQLVRPVALAAGRHHLLLKVTRGGVRPGLVVALARQDGQPSDLTSRPASPGPLPRAAPGPFPPSAFTPRALAAALEPGGAALAALLAARDAMSSDLEAAKGLLEEGLRGAPGAAALRAARGAVHALDPTLDEQIGRGRAEAALRAALAADPGDGDVRLQLGELLRRSDRARDAAELLAALPDPLQRRPAALAASARAALDRGLAELAEATAEAALAAGGSCDALRLLAEQAARRDAVAREEGYLRPLAACRGGHDRWVRWLEQRGDAAGVLAALAPAARARPLALGPALQRAGALAAQGDHAAAARSLAPLLEAWPRSATLAKAAADQHELAGEARRARALREQALLVDGSDLGLRRALALEDGAEVLADAAQDGLAAVRAYQAAPRREGSGAALVLDASAVEVHPGGASTERVHQVARVLDQEAVDRWGELSAPSGAQVLRLRTIKADGRVLEPEAGEGKGTSSLAALEPGDYAELEYLRTTRGHAAQEGVITERFYFSTPGTSMFRSTYLVRAPRGLGLEADARNLAPAPDVQREGDREVVRVERTEVPALVAEPGAPPPPEYLPFVQVGAGGGRAAVHRAMANAAAGRLAPTLELRALAAEVRAAAGAKAGPEALARAAYERVRALVQGQGGSAAEEASQVLSRGRGSRAVLLAALLDALGLQARLAMVRPPAADRTIDRFPTASVWSHPVVRLPLPGGVRWLDPGQRLQPFGSLPEAARGAEALVLARPGEPLLADRTPERNDEPDGRELEVELALRPDGSAEVRGEDRYLGALGASAKAAFERLDEPSRRQVVEGFLGRSVRGISLGALEILGEQDPAAPFVLRFSGVATGVAREAGGAVVVEAPPQPLRLGARFLALAARTVALSVEASEPVTLRLTIRPPPGLPAVAGPPERLETPFGTFSRTERVEGGALVREDRVLLLRGRVAPEDYPAFGEFCGAVDALQARSVVLPR